MKETKAPGGLPFTILDAEGEWDRVMWWRGFRFGVVLTLCLAAALAVAVTFIRA